MKSFVFLRQFTVSNLVSSRRLHFDFLPEKLKEMNISEIGKIMREENCCFNLMTTYL